jgi:hypothetical protein
MKPTVPMLGIHLSGKKIVLTAGPADAVENLDIPSHLERYLGRPTDSSFDQLTYLEYHSQYFITDHSTSPDVHPDVCDPIRFANLRKKPMGVLSIWFIPGIMSYSL